ncbi:Spy/CpxP family protein refolding chaperone [Geobacter sp. DSM 9736]|uniref:Spy/CpxP family protein refolding chaperone n=1 Tax=Geobacter sp. DSM 9736 TaxID=1277350 RepID=UPI000B50FC83|nr:Spy/CpxP family protein refolding chaperone [Geobacter sp. DSM 9736]SNB46895.1 LTXXQ motif family protein [Geobacter sp. DSM 9736]
MKKTMVMLFLVALMLPVVLMSGCGAKTPDEKADAIVSELNDSLQLTDVQRRNLDSIMNEILNKRTQIDRQLADQIQYGFTSQLRKDKFDPAEFEEFMLKYNEQSNEMVRFIGQKLSEFHAMLSPPQRNRLVEEIAKNRERWLMQ